MMLTTEGLLPMRNLTLLVAAASALMAGSALAGAAQAAPSLYVAPAPMINAVYTPSDGVVLEQVQYFYGGRNYCWYDGGWHGPGYYWCGYAGRRGYGWGGVLGWNGWGRGGHYGRANYGHGGGHYHGGGGHGGGGHAGGGHGGGHGGHGGGGHGGGGHGGGGGHHH
jgi:hypothetical protein